MDEPRTPEMNPSPHPGAEFSAYVDGDLGAARRAEIEAHLAACARCAAVVADLRGLRFAAAALAERPPETDLWPAIEERIARSGRARVVPLIRPGPRQVTLRWTQLVAASVALVVVAGGAVWLALGGGRAPGGGGAPGAGPPVAVRGAAPAGGGERSAGAEGAAGAAGAAGAESTLVADFADETYRAAVADLEAALDASRDQLDPETVRTIERNLEIIDQAIAETRRALAADPNSGYLSAHLAEQMRRKLDVLRTATRIATTSI